MQPNTRNSFNAYLTAFGQAMGNPHGVRNETVHYPPLQQQKTFLRVSERAEFLKKLNHIPVTAQLGQRVGIGVSKPIASRTNTEIEERQTRQVADLSGDTYHCVQTNTDTHMSYRTLDAWAHTDNFMKAYNDSLGLQKARDRLMIGFNGESAATVTDAAANPLLQDVNIGWLAKVRNSEPGRIMGYDSEGAATTDTYKMGESGDYKTLDMLVFDMITNLLDPWHQGADDLVVLVGREIWTSHGLSLLSNSTLPTERNALSTWFASQTVAGLPCIMPPFFPARGVVVTSYSNLSIYYQLDTMRRAIIDNPKRDRVEEYHSENEAYVVEDFGKFAGVRNGSILLPDATGQWG
jgi:P2 family phage major capsid protein